MSSFYSTEMLEETSRVAAKARKSTADWMAQQTVKNMLHVDPRAADQYGGKAQLLRRLKASYENSLSLAS
jgi:3-mercaptopyruvate sulfurtransferase SseA